MRKVAPQLSWIEQETSKLKVVGSNPTGATKLLTFYILFEIIMSMPFKMGMLFLAIFHFSERGDFFEENIKENYSSMCDDDDVGSVSYSSVCVWLE